MKKITPSISIKKPGSQYGKWVYKPLKSTIVTCACGNKYIVTRKGQVECINCSYDRKNA